MGRRFTANLSVQVLVISVFKWEGTIFRCVVAGAGVSDMALFVVLEIKNPTGYGWGAGSGGVLRFHERSGLVGEPEISIDPIMLDLILRSGKYVRISTCD